MMYPKGEVVHQNLSTEYTDVSDLLSTLTSNGFAGIVEVVLPQELGAFFIREGQVLTAALESDSGQTTGQTAIDQILQVASKEVGTLNIYRLSPEQVTATVSKLCSDLVFKGLTTDFVKLDKFIQKLGLEGHTGYIEVFTKKNEVMGTIFLRDGNLVDLHLPSESEHVPLSEPKAIPSFIEDVIQQGAVFDVYRSIYEKITPQKQTVAHDLDLNTETLLPDSNGVEEEPLEEEAASAAENQSDGNSEEKPAESRSNGRERVLQFLGEIIGQTERFVDGFSQEGIFLRAFKRALIEKSDFYPFLDPFMDQFDYRKGQIMLDEEVGLESFAVGIADCYTLTLSHLRKEFPKNMNLSPSVKAELESTFRLYEDALRKSGLDSVPSLFFK